MAAVGYTTMNDSDVVSTESSESSFKPWLVCLTAALFFFYEFIQGNMFNTISQDLMRAYSINMEQLGELSSIYYFTNVLFLFPAGILLDRISTKKIILVSMALSVFGTFLFALSDNYSIAILCRFLTGVGSAFCFLSAIRLATRWFPTKRMALVTGSIVTMAMLGGYVSQTPLALVSDAYGWKSALFAVAVLGILIMLLIAAIVKDYPSQKESAFIEEQHDLEEVGFWRGLYLSYFKVQNILSAVYTSLLNIPVGVFGAFAGGMFLMQYHHLTHIQATNVSGMIFIGTIFGGPMVGGLSDRIGFRRLPMIIGAILSLAVILAIIYIPGLSLSQLTILFLALGFFTSSQVISYPTVAESNPVFLTATAVSVINIITQGGTAVYQPLFGHLLQQGWDGKLINKVPFYTIAEYHHALLMVPIGFVIALIAACLIKETHCTRK